MALTPILRGLFALLLLAVGVGAVSEQALRPVPPFTARVIDQTGTLDAAQQAALAQQLETLEHELGAQIAVLLVPRTTPEDIAAYANRVGNTWKLGRKDVGDGLLVVVAKDDRRMRIEVAKALEGTVPDIAAHRIIDEVMAPAFRAGDFAGGLQAAVDQLAARIRGEALTVPLQTDAGVDRKDNFPQRFLLFVAGFFILAVANSSLLYPERKLAWYVVGLSGIAVFGYGVTLDLAELPTWCVGGLMVLMLLDAYRTMQPLRRRDGSDGEMGSGGSSWSSGGGSSSSGGGGDFGGGGSSGSW